MSTFEQICLMCRERRNSTLVRQNLALEKSCEGSIKYVETLSFIKDHEL